MRRARSSYSLASTILAAWSNLDRSLFLHDPSAHSFSLLLSRCDAQACDSVERVSELVVGTLVKVPQRRFETLASLCLGWPMTHVEVVFRPNEKMTSLLNAKCVFVSSHDAQEPAPASSRPCRTCPWHCGLAGPRWRSICRSFRFCSGWFPS